MQSSLRRHLTYWLIGPLLLLVVAGSFVSYRIALDAATKAYDSALLDPVLAIASHLRRTGSRLELDLPSIAIEALRIDTEDRVYYQVLGPDSELIAGTPRLPAPPERPRRAAARPAVSRALRPSGVDLQRLGFLGGVVVHVSVA